MNPLDEIEMELGGKMSRCGFWPSTFGAGCDCERVLLCPIFPRETCRHREPVEPETTTGWCGREQGPCYLPGPNPDPQKWCFDGAKDCYCRWFRNSSWAQRAGMLEREKADWIVVVMRPNGKGDLCNLEAGTPSRNMGTEDEARAFLCSALVADYPDNDYRAFRWSDGLKGE